MKSKFLSSIDDVVQGVRAEQQSQLKAAAGYARSELALTEPPSKWKVASPPESASQPTSQNESRERIALRRSAWKEQTPGDGDEGSLSSASSTSSAGVDSRSVFQLMEAAKKKTFKQQKKAVHASQHQHNALASMQAARQSVSQQVGWSLVAWCAYPGNNLISFGHIRSNKSQITPTSSPHHFTRETHRAACRRKRLHHHDGQLLPRSQSERHQVRRPSNWNRVVFSAVRYSLIVAAVMKSCCLLSSHSSS